MSADFPTGTGGCYFLTIAICTKNGTLCVKRVKVHFYRTGCGSEPVRDWLKLLDTTSRMVIGRQLLVKIYRWQGLD